MQVRGYFAELEGWAMVKRGASFVLRPRTVDELRRCYQFARARGQSLGLRGAGCSYGDAALNHGGIVIDCAAMNRILAYDRDQGQITVEPGVTIEQLWRHVLADGWWPAVVPGTMRPTIGGCAAMNIHGKNNWRVGTIGEFICRFTLLLPSGELIECAPDQNTELFYAAIGGFGLLGAFVSLTLQLRKVSSGMVEATASRCRSLAEMLAALEAEAGRADDMVGWIDAFAAGAQLGRGILTGARELTAGEDPRPDRTLTTALQLLPTRVAGIYPRSLIWPVLKQFTNNWGMHLLNDARFNLARLRGDRWRSRESLVAFHFQLDAVPDFRRIYRPGGLIQYQVFAPTQAAEALFRAILQRSQRLGTPAYLAGLKKHRADTAFLMSYLCDGYSLALDYPVTAANQAALTRLFAELTPIVFAHSGRFYLAKDTLLTAEHLPQLYPATALERFVALKQRYDPDLLVQTDLFNRLFAPAVANQAQAPVRPPE
jgi:decaprenylphospho-beta-D-ribofuranose 2-oxidase